MPPLASQANHENKLEMDVSNDVQVIFELGRESRQNKSASFHLAVLQHTNERLPLSQGREHAKEFR
jgi:hypothetical protein